MKKLITAAIAFNLFMATTANALPVCYSMTEDGDITDLSHMCPASEQPVTISARRAPEPAVEAAIESPKATFQVRRINRTNWTATGTVSFSRTAANPGDRVVPYLRYAGVEELTSLPAVTYIRGDRRTDITFSVIPGTSLGEVEGGVR